MFIVAVTLALLAAMGVYGLTATAYDLRAAGHGRLAAQSQRSAELAITMTSTALTPGNAQTIVNRMRADRAVRGSMTCTTALPPFGDEAANRTAESCLVLTPVNIGPLTADPVAWPASLFNTDSFGDVTAVPSIRVELTNPIDQGMGGAPAGFSVSSGSGPPPVFTQVRATVFVEMRNPGKAAEAVAIGRGRLVVGPYMP